ncbi:MAG: EamA family transporter [Actinobacteria bacterium]|nr:EamA family transporter [Actinomycetota bacterium]
MNMAVPTQGEPVSGGLARAHMSRPSRIDVLWIGVAVAFISASGPLITATVAPALAIAFWRCFLGSGATGIWVAFKARSEFRRLSRGQWRLIIVSGLLLGAHFATWVPSLRFTSVASATALVATQPVWAALIARSRGVRIQRSVWIGMAISLMGVLVLTGVDVSLDPRQLIGDVLALLGAMLSAAYFTVSAEARKTVSTSTLTFGLYGTAALLLVALCLLLRQPLVGFSAEAWILILTLTLTAQLLGHSLINKVLATTSATVVSLAILFELPASTIIAAVALGQVPPWGIIPAAALIITGLIIVIRSSDASELTEAPPV